VNCSTPPKAVPDRVGGRRQEYYHDPDAPRANSLAPTAFAVVRDGPGRVLLVRRCDSGNWELPGGRIDLGESAATAAVREVAEEAGMDVMITGLAGVYSDPAHVVRYPGSGEVRQQMAVCFHATARRGTPRPDGVESCAAAWVEPSQLGGLPIHPTMRVRIDHALAEPARAHYS
jgi:8-oxo-dGTP pyrophosphatase MutT (NUDIX family)